MMAGFGLLLSALLAVVFCSHIVVSAQPLNGTVRTYFFDAKPASIPLGQTLPLETQIHRTWPKEKLRVELPDSIAAVTIHDDEYSHTLMGPPIHVQAGDRLKLSLTNNVLYTGLSLHLHGFGFGGAFEYAGSVGVSQCPLAQEHTFAYDVAVDETPGTYWYYTSSGHFGVDAYDAIRGPLIVHPTGNEELVDTLNDFSSSSLSSGYSRLAYANERILFLQDGFLSSGAHRYLNHIGNLVPPPSKSDEGIIAATSPWQFGTCNGKLRDVIHVAHNQKYKFRLINGGQHFALRFAIDGFPLTVVAADSQPVEAYTVDEIILHVGERFDVEVIVHDDLQIGESFWIRADTLESQTQGFQNGIRAILRVSDQLSIPSDDDVLDPTETIDTFTARYFAYGVDRDRTILNCHHATGCLPITSLSPLGVSKHAEAQDPYSEIHTVDAHFEPAPQYGHFISIDNSFFTQNELPPVAAMISHKFRASNSVHPHAMGLRVPRSSSVVIVWRTSLLMDVPIHIHGQNVEILDVAYPDLRKDCNLHLCRLSQAYESREKLRSLDKIPPNRVIKKDTFVVPAGGAVVTRILDTGGRGIWLANGVRDIHREDGISFVLIVGDYQIPQMGKCRVQRVLALELN